MLLVRASDSLFGGSWSIENLRSTFDLKQKFDLLKVERNLHRLFDEKDVNDAVTFSADRGHLWSKFPVSIFNFPVSLLRNANSLEVP